MRLAAVILLVALPAAAQDYVVFRSPSGNISCMMMTGDWSGARCDIARLIPSFRTPPADCDLDWGQAFEVAATGPGRPICVGDTVADAGAPVLPYGRSFSLGGVTCTSERTGMTCVNAGGGGFTIARARQSVF